ncbi:hypothetical protein ABK040_005809 [Willaertia magna]
MKWIDLSSSPVDIEKQADEVAELYKVLFLQLKLSKQQELHEMLKDQNEHKESPAPEYKLGEEWVKKIDKMKLLKSLNKAIENRIIELDSHPNSLSNTIFSRLKEKLEEVIKQYPLRTIQKIEELKQAMSSIKKQYDEEDDKTRGEVVKTHPIKSIPLDINTIKIPTKNETKQNSHKPETKSVKKVKPIYEWELRKSKPKEHQTPSEILESFNEEFFTPRFKNVGDYLNQELKYPSPKRLYSKEKERNLHAPNSAQFTPEHLTNYQLKIQMPKSEFQKLQNIRNSPEQRRRPRSVSPATIKASSPIRSTSPRLYHSSSKPFLQKGSGRLASDGNPFRVLYSSPSLMYNTSNLLSGYSHNNRSGSSLKEVERSVSFNNIDAFHKEIIQTNLKSKSNVSNYSVADIEGLYITSVGKYEPKHRVAIREESKEKWVTKKGFITATHETEEFTRDKTLPKFINTGVTFDSYCSTLHGTGRTEDKEKFISQKPFVSAFPSSGVDFVDKQYSLGNSSPTRGSIHSFNLPQAPPLRGISPIQMSLTLLQLQQYPKVCLYLRIIV